jgi:hypothetical protein
MARIKVHDGFVSVLTGDDSNAYRSAGRTPKPEITVPLFRARLDLHTAKRLAEALTEAVKVAEQAEREGQ